MVRRSTECRSQADVRAESGLPPNSGHVAASQRNDAMCHEATWDFVKTENHLCLSAPCERDLGLIARQKLSHALDETCRVIRLPDKKVEDGRIGPSGRIACYDYDFHVRPRGTDPGSERDPID